MTRRKQDDAAGFLSRWSQRKQAAREPEDAAPPAEEAGGEVQPADLPAQEVAPEELPDIETLEAGSDFTPFLKKGVPQTLKQRALRKLWQVDPAFREICMLDDYNLDYTDAATVVPNLKTLYQVGRGMVLPDETPVAEEATEEAVATEAGTAVEGAAEPAAVADESGAAAADLPAEPEPDSASEADSGRQALPAAVPEAVPVRPAPRKPGTPRVTPAASAAASPANRGAERSRPAPRSARQRRWGDPEA